MPELSDEADALYEPLGDLGPWADVPVDEGAWAGAGDRLRALRRDLPLWSDMVVDCGALLAAAHQSAALDGLYPGHRDTALALLGGDVAPPSLGADQQAHVRANYDALLLARAEPVSAPALRRLHEVACRPQLTHRVLVDGRAQDHVLAAGDYKHHPNHVPLPSGGWRPAAPVASVRAEVDRLVEVATGERFAGLHPVSRAAWLHHAVDHVRPFADGNGRVARALASGCLLRAVGLPLLVFAGDAPGDEVVHAPAALVDLVVGSVVALVDLLAGLEDPASSAALERWRAQEAAAADRRASLPPAVGRALERYRQQPEARRRADLTRAEVVSGDPLVVRVALDDGRVVDETVTVVAHPLDGGPVVVVAEQAAIAVEAGAPLDPWLDRVLSCLALRVAAELEP